MDDRGFGDRLGVSKQTISNLENAKMQISLIQYIAIRAILDYEIEEHPVNEVLSLAIHLLLDEEENLSEEDYEKVKQAIDMVAAAKTGGVEETVLFFLFTKMIGTVAADAGIGMISPLGIVGGVASAFWFKSVMEK
ncbi:MAG: helix-turn-helix transcriptional regulator [Oscillospiraceae bacterium]|nr:helix-turn-helix transcriptional regulator [Oscillospiraceae bacterium]